MLAAATKLDGRERTIGNVKKIKVLLNNVINSLVTKATGLVEYVILSTTK